MLRFHAALVTVGLVAIGLALSAAMAFPPTVMADCTGDDCRQWSAKPVETLLTVALFSLIVVGAAALALVEARPRR